MKKSCPALVSATLMVILAGLGCGDGSPSHQCTQPVPISQDITTETTLDRPCYLVTEVIFISAKLTVMPGVALTFQQDTGLLIQSDGALNAVGTAQSPIHFTGEQQVRGYWRGLEFHNSNSIDNVLSYAFVEHGGSYEPSGAGSAANIALTSSGFPVRLTLTRSTVRQSAGYGFYFSRNAVVPNFGQNIVTANASGAGRVDAEVAGALDSGSAYVGNDVDEVYVTADTLSTAQTWSALDVPYHVAGLLFIDARLTVAPGATLVFGQDSGMVVRDQPGALVAAGTAQAPILMTGVQPARGYWSGVEFHNASSIDNALDHVTVEYGGGDQGGLANVALTSSGLEVLVSISNCTLRHSGGYGFYFADDAIVPSFANNVVTENALGAGRVTSTIAGYLEDSSTYAGNDVDVVVMDADRVDVTQTWKGIDVPYLIDGVAFVHTLLNIAPGAQLIFKLDSGLSVVDNAGQLSANGTTERPLLFSGEERRPGAWRGLEFYNSDSANNSITHATIEYGGGNEPSGAGSAANIALTSSGFPVRATIQDCTIRDSAGWGAWLSVNAVTNDVASSNTFSGNASGSVFQQQ